MHKLYTFGQKFQLKILQPKLCIEKYERIHCYNYNRKIELQCGFNRYKERERNEEGYEKGKKSYSEILLHLTREQSYQFDNGGCFLFGTNSRKISFSTILDPNEPSNAIESNKKDLASIQKINVKELLRKGEVPPNSEAEDTLYLSEEENVKVVNKFPAFMSEKTIDDFDFSDKNIFGKKGKNPKHIRSNRVSLNKCVYDTISEMEKEAITKESAFLMDKERLKTTNDFYMHDYEDFAIKAENLLTRKIQPTKISSDALILHSKQSTPPKFDIKKIIFIDSKNKLKKNKEHTKTITECQKSTKASQSKNSLRDKKDILIVNSQKMDLKKSSSIKAWCYSNSDKSKIFDTQVSRSLEAKHKCSKSEAIDLLKKVGHFESSNKKISKKHNSNYQSSDMGAVNLNDNHETEFNTRERVPIENIFATSKTMCVTSRGNDKKGMMNSLLNKVYQEVNTARVAKNNDRILQKVLLSPKEFSKG